MSRFSTVGRLAGALLPLSLWSCAHGPDDAVPRAPATEPDGGTVVVADGGSAVAPGVASAAPDASDDGGSREAAVDSGPPDDAAEGGGGVCTGSTAIVGGAVAGASTIAFAATRVEGGAWAVSSLPTNVASAPAIVPFGSGFVVVFVDVTGALEFASSSWSWSSPAAIAGKTAMGAPSLAVVGSSLHLVYQGTDGKYEHGTYTAGTGWDGADDPIGGASKQGFGPSAPVAESAGGELVIAYGGQDGYLYDESWAGGAWVPDDEHTAAQIGSLSPAIAALNGGASDTLVVYANASGTLYATTRSSGVWTTPAVINTNAFTNAAPSLVALAGGRAMMTYLGTDEHPYFSVYDPSTAPPWTSPAAIGTDSPTLASPPSVAAGVCGDEAVAVLAEATGVVAIRYASGAWLPPTLLEGTAGMTFASVASQP
jgi:hypothetical protein